jgi:hypothetical protein
MSEHVQICRVDVVRDLLWHVGSVYGLRERCQSLFGLANFVILRTPCTGMLQFKEQASITFCM